ncbi:Putative DNA-binding protein ESCAROLA [Apostasia shenzhenica]|uniref:AT-hook motif nuclear-localized protein n=1 Tax=Apostasia shenzhenica TaxID=1088818 RepID=A0A2H9ZWG7_9ASPA|nr:Putative DNA-binding protein ESCAROLA [Apostasia shenzhenica]
MEGREEAAAGGFVANAVDSSRSCQPQLAAAAAAAAAAASPSVAARDENPNQGGGAVSSPLPLPLQPDASAMPFKKKRGRPRKYAAEGNLLFSLNPMPISSSMPPGQYSAPAAKSMKRGRGRYSGFFSKQKSVIEFDSLGEMVCCSAGANFTPHVITVATNEDVTSKIMSFSQQGPKAICILSAIGVISNVTIRQPDSSGGTLTYEGRFEILSLSGSFMPNNGGGMRSRCGGMSISVASPDGRVLGGGVAGLLVAASPVQVVVGSFLPSYLLEQKAKKAKMESSAAVQAAGVPVSYLEMEDNYSSGQGQNTPYVLKPNLATSSSFRGENWSTTLHFSAPDSRNSTNDIDISVPGG